MLRLGPAQKRALLAQHDATHAPTRASVASAHPEQEADGNFRRFSLAAMGWGRPASTFIGGGGGSSSSNPASSPPGSPLVTSPAHPIVEQSTGTSQSAGWSTWWSLTPSFTGTSQAGSAGEKDTPAFYAERLRASHKQPSRELVKLLIALRVRLSTARLSWTVDFVETSKSLEGLQGVLERLTAKRLNRKERHSDEDGTVQLECIKCLRAIMNTEVSSVCAVPSHARTTDARAQVGFQQVLTRPSIVTAAVSCLDSGYLRLGVQVADVLAALCIVAGNEGHKLVIDAFADLKLARDEAHRFQTLLDSLSVDTDTHDFDSRGAEEDSAIWDYRTSAMSLVNAITNGPDDIDERIMLRDELTRRGLNEIMTALRYLNPPEGLQRQLQVYADERREDLEDVHSRAVGGGALPKCVLLFALAF